MLLHQEPQHFPGLGTGDLDVFFFVDQINPRAAARMDELFGEAAERLSDFPSLGHAGRIPGTCELIPRESYGLGYAV